MGKPKTHKSVQKRFKVSSGGKIRRRRVKLNHFNAKDSGNMRRNKKGMVELSSQDGHSIKKLL